MASRRTVLPRAARPSIAPAPPPAAGPSTRSRTVPGKSNPSQASQRSAVATPAEEKIDVPPPSKLTKIQPGERSDDSGGNIKVVIRCRRRSDREIQENSPIIVTSDGAKSQEITIETAIPVSSLGLVTLPPTRTYPFDMVFGPEADQAMIYQDVVSPMLEEVLQGYNCTLFAYGQTGTGKTFTMQGDLTRTPMGNPSAQAGMVPRALFKLFHQLESSGADYSVKISYIELYNEELRDLLASDLTAPSASAQPMDRGTKDAGQGLKIFDDASKKGVFIQGLEECLVKDAQHALALLTKGSQRRQIAATKFNDHSSRSHSVFSITVHSKETSNLGDDLLKIGKLNLVDLAGSENIGRSGAENKRAREAGMINQSLLTLGRVINALVDKSSHIPYRESKLTRLLQDSLGGRTKTCIIATISPSRSNMEETLSTLDYAIRAKSIRNKPELNQRMSRNALLKDYVGEIERLKADVLAAREKNGIFFSEETWMQMSAEQEIKETERLESKKQVEIVESQLRNVREEFEQSIALLTKRDGELKETKERLSVREEDLVVKDGQLKVVKGALEEEIVVRQAHQETEAILDGVASSLRQVANQSVDDLGRLHSKLERKTSVFTSNVKTVSSHTRKISSETREFTLKLEDFIKLCNQHLKSLRTEAELYRTKELESHTGTSSRITQQLEKLEEELRVIKTKDEASDEAVASLHTAVQEAQEGLKNTINSWSEGLRQHCEATCKEAEATTSASCTSIEKAFKSLGSIAETILQEAQDYISAERKSLQEAKSLADNTSASEIARLQQQNALLVSLLESEKVKAERAKDDLVKKISGLLGTFTAERDRSLREAFSEMTESNDQAEKGMLRLGEVNGQRLDEVIEKGKEWGIALDKKAGELKRNRDGGFKTISTASSSMHGCLSDMQETVSGAVPGLHEELQKRFKITDAAYTDSLVEMSRTKRARTDATEAMATDVQSAYRYIQRVTSASSHNADQMTTQVLSEGSSISQAAEMFHQAASTHLGNIHQTNQTLADQGARDDLPTGTTPRKRSWDFTAQWSLTKSREVLVKEWKGHGAPSSHKLEAIPLDGLLSHEGSESEHEDSLITETADGSYRLSEAEDGEETVKIMKSPQIALPSLTSSTSSATSSALWSEPPPLIAPPAEMKKPLPAFRSGIPGKGLLTERSTNMATRRGSKLSRRL